MSADLIKRLKAGGVPRCATHGLRRCDTCDPSIREKEIEAATSTAYAEGFRHGREEAAEICREEGLCFSEKFHSVEVALCRELERRIRGDS